MKRELCGLPLLHFLMTFTLISGSPFQYSMFQGSAYSGAETRQRNKWVIAVHICTLMKSSLISMSRVSSVSKSKPLYVLIYAGNMWSSCLRQDWLIGDFFLQKLVRPRRAQERKLCRRGKHGEFRAAGGFTVSTGPAKLRATSDVSSQKARTLDGRLMCFALSSFLFFCIFMNIMKYGYYYPTLCTDKKVLPGLYMLYVIC